ncbi:MAG: SDR family oxidoreductase [Bacteroidota bacterium]
MDTWKNKVAIITGSSMGIGFALARQILEGGGSVVINGRNPQKLQAAKAALEQHGFQPLAVAADISVWEDCERLIQETVSHFGRLDILINNAGVATRGSVENMTHEVMAKVLTVNINGCVFPTKAALPHLISSQGSVSFVSSIASFYGLPFNSVYAASKRALGTFAEALRIESKQAGLHVGVAYVGFTENDPKKVVMDADGKPIYLPNREGIKKQTPDQVASIILRMIRRRKAQVVLSPMGKGLYLASRLFPGLIGWFLQKNYSTIKAQAETEAKSAK